MKTTIVGFVLAAIVLAIVVSPAIPYSEAGDARKVTSSIEDRTTNITKTVMIVGHDDPQFVPNVVYLKVGDSIRFINQDGKDGGLAHHVISVDSIGIPDGRVSATIENSGDTYIHEFTRAGTYHFTDSAYTQMHVILVVS